MLLASIIRRPHTFSRAMTMLGALIVFSLASAVWSYPSGAPAGACDTMAPNTAAKPKGHGAPPQIRPSEFVVTISVGANGWMPNTEYTSAIEQRSICTKINDDYSQYNEEEFVI